MTTGNNIYYVAQDGDFICYGKEAEILLNRTYMWAVHMFIMDKLSSQGWSVKPSPVNVLRTIEIDNSSYPLKNDKSDEYLKMAKDDMREVMILS